MSHASKESSSRSGEPTKSPHAASKDFEPPEEPLNWQDVKTALRTDVSESVHAAKIGLFSQHGEDARKASSARGKADGLYSALSARSSRRDGDRRRDEREERVFAEGSTDIKAPTIFHDHGALDTNGQIDDTKRRKPKLKDKMSLLMWNAILIGAKISRPDLEDASEAYEHFLSGKGKTQTVRYGNFLREDAAGRKIRQSLLEDAKRCIVEIYDGKESFHLRSNPIPVGRDGRYPGPATENWQKTIGAHVIWFEADAHAKNIDGLLQFSADLTIHMEDRYNFNPGEEDRASGISDAYNCRFEVTDLAQEYMNTATVFEHLEFSSSHKNLNKTEKPSLPQAPGSEIVISASSNSSHQLANSGKMTATSSTPNQHFKD